MKIAVIGAGAAGMIAAVTAKSKGAEVTIYEHMPRIGKKLLLTGSGKCNISNDDMDLSHYHSEDESLHLVKNVFAHVSKEDVIKTFENLGLITKNKRGYIYPFSEQASSVLDVLRFSLRDSLVEVITDVDISSIDINDNGQFLIMSSLSASDCYDKIIIATGSCAYRQTGSDGSGYNFAKRFGHSIVKPLPALTPLICEGDFFASVAGIRTYAKVTICDISETGELQLTKTGISGINVFNLSYLAAKALDKGENVFADIDFLPDINSDDLKELMKRRIRENPSRTIEELFIGILHKNLGIVLIKKSDVYHKLNDRVSNLSEKEILSVCDTVKCFKIPVYKCSGFDNSQVVCGGVNCLEINDNLESKKTPGVYFAGEVLDVNGDCGGYNLTFAFASGIYAALCASKQDDKN